MIECLSSTRSVKLNTNVYTLSNGKLLLPGRWCVRDTFANTPCVIISDDGKIDGDWRIFEHNNLNMVLEMKKSLNSNIKKYVISHMAYTLHTSHDELENEMKKHDIITAYDGLTIEL